MYDYGGWYFPAPPVCTTYWAASSWSRYMDSYRPRGYYGPNRRCYEWVQFASSHNNQAVIDEYVSSWPDLFNQEF